MFLLVPAHPGFPGQIPQSRKTVVCCVCCISITTSADRMYVEVTLSVTVSVELHVVMYISACFFEFAKNALKHLS